MLATIIRRLGDTRTVTRLLSGAEAAANADGQELPDVEHLVLSACALPDGTAARALRAAGLDPEELPTAIRRTHNAALGAPSDDGEPTRPAQPLRGLFRMSAGADAAFRRTHDLHQQTGGRLRGAHVVLAASEQTRGTWARTLAMLEVDPEAVAAAARAQLGE